jgi:hypothetical protein
VAGVYCYFGVTTSGKTTLALRHLFADVERDGRPALILDCMPARNLRAYAHLPDRRAVGAQLYEHGMHAVYTPPSTDDLEKVLAGVHAAGIAGTPVHVLWDEAALNQSPQSIADGISKAIRGWQHSDVTYRIVSQRPADLHGIVFAALPEVYCFRLEREADLDRVRKELRLDPAQVEKLDQGQYLTYRRDRFAKVEGGAA